MYVILTYINFKMATIQPEYIIDPAPAQVSVSGSHIENISETSSTVTISEHRISREDRIKFLKEKLRIIKNVSQSLNNYMQFQQIMDPKLRVIIDANQWIMMLLVGKSVISSVIESDYVDIVDPPQDLKDALEESYNNVESIVNAFTTSMTQIVTLMQSQLLNVPPSESPNILSSMNNSILPSKTRLPS